MTFSKLTYKTYIPHSNVDMYDSRRGEKVGGVLVHHMAGAGAERLAKNMQAGNVGVSANYVCGDKVFGVVPEEYRAYTSGSASDGGKGAAWDRKMITVETENNTFAPHWTVSDKTFDNLARLIADCAYRYKFPINDNTILTHQELWTRYRASYPTACPGNLQVRKAELIRRANVYLKEMNGGKPVPTPTPVPQPKPEPARAYDGRAVPGVHGPNPFGIPMTGGLQKVAKLYGYGGALDQHWGSADPFVAANTGSMQGFAKFLRQNWGYVGNDVLGPNMWRSIQRWLKSKWGYTGDIDGIPGPLTRLALLRADSANFKEL